MYFVDDCYAKNFLCLVANNSKERHTNYWAAYHLLTCKNDVRVKTMEHIGRFIDWLGILNEDFSDDYQCLVQFAFMIFSNTSDELTEIVGFGHIEYYDVITQAIEIRKNGICPFSVK